MPKYLRAVLVAAAVAVATITGATAAQADVVTSESVTTAEGVVVTTYSNGVVTREAPEGTAEAADTSCTGHAVCFWKQTNYRGDKYEVSVTDRDCWNVYPGQPNKIYIVKSLKVGGSTAISSMRTGQNCHGTPSMSYRPGARVPSTTFYMKSFR
ncbi:hypothetical protein FKR81_25900 [Lentzea tibetensis]|uniref:Peptidase inhibitor family I36 n=1 Tax=Lentzea tibetensis TaxID=2591470 RepID=A0A563EPG6_9PSEU|nr:peptidase inhibitor family I36 protein [Lentzea tibetensis]TWP49105.1 hypothetical protein FKR81_25900 [Lentzea tibetensis]